MSAFSQSSSSNSTPSGGDGKRKHTGTPASSEPAGKHTYANTAGADGGEHAPKPKPQAHILWVHSNLEEKGKVSEGYFNLVISRCNQIKIGGILRGETEFAWCPDMHGQPSFDDINSRGKIVCRNKKIIDFWVKWIPIASNNVGDIPLKAWTREEYMVKSTRYSCLIPKNSCIGMDVEDLIKTSFIIHGIKKLDGVLSCRTTYVLNSSQRICHIELTDQFSELLESCGRILSGPAGPLSFRPHSESEDAATDEPMQVESSSAKQIILPTLAVDALLDDMSVGGGDDVDIDIGTDSAATNNMLDGSCSNALNLSPTGSETDVTQSLATKFKQMGNYSSDQTKPISDNNNYVSWTSSSITLLHSTISVTIYF